MSDIRERRRKDEHDGLQRELDRIHERQDRSADSRRVQGEIDRVLKTPEKPARGLDHAKERLDRLDPIAERDPTRQLPGFDPEKVRKSEDLEIRANPDGFVRRHEGGMDSETERKLRDSLRDRRR